MVVNASRLQALEMQAQWKSTVTGGWGREEGECGATSYNAFMGCTEIYKEITSNVYHNLVAFLPFLRLSCKALNNRLQTEDYLYKIR